MLSLVSPAWSEEGEAAASNIYYDFPEPFTINFLTQSDQKMRYLQIKVSLKSKDAALIEGAESILPMMQDALRTLFSNQTYDSISSVNGREQLQAQSLDTLKTLLSDEIGNDALDNVYFTSFIMQ
jgi:flagellar FliL protein